MAVRGEYRQAAGGYYAERDLALSDVRGPIALVAALFCLRLTGATDRGEYREARNDVGAALFSRWRAANGCARPRTIRQKPPSPDDGLGATVVKNPNAPAFKREAEEDWGAESLARPVP
jgi:hypothetical protein